MGDEPLHEFPCHSGMIFTGKKQIVPKPEEEFAQRRRNGRNKNVGLGINLASNKCKQNKSREKNKQTNKLIAKNEKPHVSKNL